MVGLLGGFRRARDVQQAGGGGVGQGGFVARLAGGILVLGERHAFVVKKLRLRDAEIARVALERPLADGVFVFGRVAVAFFAGLVHVFAVGERGGVALPFQAARILGHDKVALVDFADFFPAALRFHGGIFGTAVARARGKQGERGNGEKRVFKHGGYPLAGFRLPRLPMRVGQPEKTAHCAMFAR